MDGNIDYITMNELFITVDRRRGKTGPDFFGSAACVEWLRWVCVWQDYCFLPDNNSSEESLLESLETAAAAIAVLLRTTDRWLDGTPAIEAADEPTAYLEKKINSFDVNFAGFCQQINFLIWSTD